MLRGTPSRFEGVTRHESQFVDRIGNFSRSFGLCQRPNGGADRKRQCGISLGSLAELFKRDGIPGTPAHLPRSIPREQSDRRQWWTSLDSKGRRLLEPMQQTSEGSGIGTALPREPGFGATAFASLRERKLVGGRGIEPLTPSMSRKCSSAELTALPKSSM